MNIDAIVVGAGIAGTVLARRLAEEENRRVLVVERRSHIGGYCYDERNEEGVLVHRYGPHIFRTDSKKVWEFLSRFTRWHDYQHKVLTYVDGMYLPMPINLDTVNRYLGSHYSAENVMDYFERHRTHPEKVCNVRDVVESQIGPEFYHAFFEKYTEKQWGMPCDELPPEIVARIPIRSNRDDRYFTHKYQALPRDGYTHMMQNMLTHPNIHILLNTDYRVVRDAVPCEHIYYSGSIDEYHGHRFGRLPYRSVDFVFETIPCAQYQSAAVVNYPNNYDYTRVTEFRHFYGQSPSHTVIAREYPGSDGDPSYPIPTRGNTALYGQYASIPHPGVSFIGRLGEYRYYSMDQIVEKMLATPLHST